MAGNSALFNLQNFGVFGNRAVHWAAPFPSLGYWALLFYHCWIDCPAVFNSPQPLMALMHKMQYQPSPASLDSWKGYQLTDLGFDSISPLHKFPAQFLGKRRADRRRILSDSNHLVRSYLYGVIVRHSDRQGPKRREGYCHLDAIWHDVIRWPKWKLYILLI